MQQSSLGSYVGRYVLLERLGTGGMGQVFRARDRLGVEVALKRLALRETGGDRPSGERPALAFGASTDAATDRSGEVAAGVVPASSLARPIEATLGLALAREFRALRSLYHPNVVEVLDFGFEDGKGPFFTMQLLSEAAPITTAARGAPFETKVDLFGQLLRAVRYIHARGVLHRDLSPNNVLVERGTVKVLDFGLAVLRDDRDARLERWGTRGYRAPELTVGAHATPSSDLFAVGVLGLEMFLEARVHDAAEIGRALDAVDPRVRPLLTELTHEDFRSRPTDAREVIVKLAAATGVIVPLDTAATLESALTTINLVGRDRELALFDGALHDLIGMRRGSAWRLRGESGVGKSRLMDELRTRALVAGCLVVEGQSLREGGGPYEALAGVVRGLALHVDVSDADALALSPAADVTSLARPTSGETERFSRDMPSDPEIVRTRLFAAIERLLRGASESGHGDGTSSPARPVVLLLEDLQWSTGTALALIDRIAGLTATMPLLVVASHREGVSALVEKALSTFVTVPVERLSEGDAALLARAAIGDASAELASRFARESEGHPFFLLELLRSHVEHGAAVTTSGPRGLPGRIEALVRSRLDHLSEPDRALFQVAAVVGRDVHRDLVEAVGDASAEIVDAWVAAGLDAGLLEIRGDHVRFVHDMLREGILRTLPDDERRRLHLRTGEAIARGSQDPAAHCEALAHHFTMGGDRSRTAQWAAVAGERALAAGANAEAIRLLGEALAASGPGDDPVHRARLARLTGVAHLRIGNYVAAHERGLAALGELGRSQPMLPLRAAQMLRDAALLVAQARRALGARRASTALDEATLAYYQVSETAFLRDAPGDMCWSILRALALANGAPAASQVTIYSAAGLVAGTMHINRVANAWAGRAISLATENGSPALLASALHRHAVSAVVGARWRQALELLAEAREAARRGEDRRQWQETSTVLGLVAAYRGDLAGAAALFAEVHESAKAHGDRQGALWGGPLGALCHLRLGQTARAEVLLREAHERIDEATSAYDRINFHGPRSLLWFGLGDRAAAVREATDAVDRLARIRLSAYWTFHGLDAALTTLLAALESEEAPAVRRTLARDVARGCAEARRLARFCVFATPSALMWEGQRRALAGDLDGARKRWVKAETLARQHDLPHVAAAARRLCER